MRIVLTGATGFVGSYVALELLLAGHDVAIMVRKESNGSRIQQIGDRLKMITADLRNLRDAADAIAAFAPAAFVHLAWEGVLNRSRNDLAQWRNLPIAMELIELAARVGASHWVGLGSQAEYGPYPGRIDESAVTRPTTLYGAAKLATCFLAERLCERLHLRFAWLRLFSSYGPTDNPDWMIPYVMRSLLRGESPQVTAGGQLWDYIYVGDAARAIASVAEQPRATGIFNLGSGKSVPLRTIIEQIRDLVDPELDVSFGAVPYRPDQVMHLEADISRLIELTGWHPRTELASGIAKTLEWHRGQCI